MIATVSTMVRGTDDVFPRRPSEAATHRNKSKKRAWFLAGILVGVPFVTALAVLGETSWH